MSMRITKIKEKVRDGYLGDLPEGLQTKVMNIHKLIKDTVHDILEEDNYEDLKSSSWAMSCIDEFCVMPKDKGEVGSIRVYKNGKTYRCMIQATGHFRNHQYGWIEELLHDFIGNVYATIRPKIRRKYDMTITNEGRTGEPFEGFDIYPNPKTVKDIWDSLEDRKTKTITESVDQLPTDKSAATRLSWKLFTEIRGAVGLYIDNHVGMFHELLDEIKLQYREMSKYDIYRTYCTDTIVIGDRFKLCNWYYDDEYRACVDENKYKNVGYIGIQLYEWGQEDINDATKKMVIDINEKLKTMTIDKMKQLGYIGELFFDYGDCGGTDKSYGTAYWIIRYDELVPELPDDIQRKVETYKLLEDRIYNHVTESYDDYFYEKSHGLLKSSFRMGINKENGHLIKLVFDLNPEDVTLVGSHDDTNPIPDEDQDKIAKNIRKTGFTDFASTGVCKAIVDMDTNEKLQTVKCVGIMNGAAQWAKKPLKEREKDIANGALFGGAKTYTVGKSEASGDPRRRYREGSYKTTKAPRSVDDLHNIVNGHRQGRGYVKEDTASTPEYSEQLEGMNKDTFGASAECVNIEESSFQDLADYYEEYSNMSYDDFFYERSNGKLTKSFRVVKDISTGHTIKIVFDLDIDSIKNIGHHIKNINPKLEELKPKVKSDGHNTFTSIGTVLAIIDVDDGNKKLNSVTAIGPIYSNDEPITYTVGKKETVPTFKSTSGRTIYRDGNKHFYDTSKENVQSEIDIMGSTRVPGHGDIKKARHLETIGAPTKRYRTVMKRIEEKNARDLEKKKTCKHEWVPIPDTYHVKNMSKCPKCGLYKTGKGVITSDSGGVNEFREAAASTPEYNVDMSEAAAKKTLRTLSQSIINDTTNKKGHKVSQYTANIYANIITKNLLPIWAKGFRKFSITLDTYQSFNTFEFKVPTMTQDFVSRFVNGRESINGFVHRNAEIKVKMSPRIFHTMKNPDDAYRFFKAAIKYYDSGLEKACMKMMAEVMKLNTEMKHLISTTKLSGIVTYPMTLLFVFDDVSMDNIDTFRITSDDIATVNKFIRSIYTRYAAPDKEKKKIVDDVKEMVKALRESCDSSDENIHNLVHFPEAVEKYMSGGFDSEMALAKDNWIYEQIDHEWNKRDEGQLKYLREAFGVKKLKKIPADLVAYISIEAESIRDANDKMMISSYCLGKIEIVEWYIELLEVGSKKYIVPHTKPYLQSVRTQLLACFKKIMDTPIPKADRPLIDITYPKGYEG